MKVIYGDEEKPEKDKPGDRYRGAKKVPLIGNPDPLHMNVSINERQNLNMRMSIRRFGRKTNAFSKKIENHTFAVGLHFMYYNFGRIHRTLRVTPAMEAGLTDHVWSIEEIAGLYQYEVKPRGPYKKLAA